MAAREVGFLRVVLDTILSSSHSSQDVAWEKNEIINLSCARQKFVSSAHASAPTYLGHRILLASWIRPFYDHGIKQGGPR